MIRRVAARSISATAARRCSSACSRDPASRTRRIAVRMRERVTRFRLRASRLDCIRFLALLMFGISD